MTSRAAGTARATCSSGSVTSINICFAGMLPASTSTRIRGKLVTGKSPTGSVIAANAPASANAKATVRSERRWRSIQAEKLTWRSSASVVDR